MKRADRLLSPHTHTRLGGSGMEIARSTQCNITLDIHQEATCSLAGSPRSALASVVLGSR